MAADSQYSSSVIFDRQRQLLSLLDALGGRASTEDFQNLLFLHCQGMEEPRPYEFVPHGSGPYSFTLHADKRRLAERGLLADDEHVWELTEKGRNAMTEDSQRKPMAAFAKSHAKLRGDKLAVESYRRFPYYAIQSEMAERLLARDSESIRKIRAARPKAASPGMRTIGYEERSLEGYLNELIRGGVTLLADVRRNPLSRKFGFAKRTLAHACENTGIRYEHLPELGIASEERRDLRTQADYDALFKTYERVTLPKQKDTLAKIRAWVGEGNVVALTCYEKVPEQCHRHRVATALERQFGASFAAEHL